MDKNREYLSSSECNLPHPIILREVADGEVNQFLEKLSKEEYLFPNNKRKRPCLTALRRELNKYYHRGFEGFERKSHNDRCMIRIVHNEMTDFKKIHNISTERLISAIKQKVQKVDVPILILNQAMAEFQFY